MAPTSDERREVAERLRFCARETNGTCDFSMYLGHWVNADDADEEQVGSSFSVQANRKSAERTLEKLADLIDPTCHDTLPATWDTFECSACGTQWAVSPVYIGPDGTTEHDLEKPAYCPHCGSRVVDE